MLCDALTEAGKHKFTLDLKTHALRKGFPFVRNVLVIVYRLIQRKIKACFSCFMKIKSLILEILITGFLGCDHQRLIFWVFGVLVFWVFFFFPSGECLTLCRILLQKHVTFLFFFFSGSVFSNGDGGGKQTQNKLRRRCSGHRASAVNRFG